MDALVFLMVLAILLAGMGFGIRYRSNISKWLNDPYSNTEYRKKMLKRQIEDAQEELGNLDKHERG